MPASTIRTLLLTTAFALATVSVPWTAHAHTAEDATGVGVTVEIAPTSSSGPETHAPLSPGPEVTPPVPHAPSLGETGSYAVPAIIVTSLVLVGAGTAVLLRSRGNLPRPRGQAPSMPA